MMRPVLYLLLSALLFLNVHSGHVFAEEPDVQDLSVRERTFVGGFLGLQVGTFTAVSINLHAGYRVTNRISAGIAGSYQYANDTWSGESYSSHMYGASTFVRFRVYSQFFLHGEYERIQLQSRLPRFGPDFDPDERSTVTEDNIFLGAGYAIPLSERVRLNMLALYNLNQDSQAYFDNPFFRVGVDIFL